MIVVLYVHVLEYWIWTESDLSVDIIFGIFNHIWAAKKDAKPNILPDIFGRCMGSQ